MTGVTFEGVLPFWRTIIGEYMFNLKKFAVCAAPLALAIAISTPTKALAQEVFIGEIKLVGYTFCPRGYASAEGQLLPISQNTALFSLYGTTFGGDGRTNFALPDLRGRTPIGTGNGPGLISAPLGDKSGADLQTLSISNLPPHNHQMQVNNLADGADKARPATDYLAVPSYNNPNNPAENINIYSDTQSGETMATDAITNTGLGQAFDNRMPFTVMRYCVALQGIFPSRS
ncbi:tail fiber protein [Sulfitobacter sp. F26169L]|uniref:phage tail protein n=1 Tax=Sulfitobacter sp. F26169L TaxID=2996015 RepID=UPI002260E006|nr:tail fiber protein [Sulfitobacter sp. F26169L]MCX7564824.1 tail fiber protein [Sulfitobacter sp. F26169L]